MSEKPSIEQRVRNVIVSQLHKPEEQIRPESSFIDDLGADSLDQVELVMAFEEEFKDEIKGDIPDTDSEKLKTVGDVINYIRERAAKA